MVIIVIPLGVVHSPIASTWSSKGSYWEWFTHLQPAHGHQRDPTGGGSLTYSQHMVIKEIPVEVVHSPTASTWSSKGSHWKWFTHLQPAHGHQRDPNWRWFTHLPPAHGHQRDPNWRWFTHLQPAHGHQRDPNWRWFTHLQPAHGHQRDPTGSPWRPIRSVGTGFLCPAAGLGSSPEKHVRCRKAFAWRSLHRAVTSL